MAFDEKVLTCCATRFLKLAGGEMLYIHLIKLLYMLDRESIRETGLPVTEDSYVSMKHGPVLSRCYDLIKEGRYDNHSFWAEHIQTSGNSLVLRRECDSFVSRRTRRLIQEIFESHGQKDVWHLIDEIHNSFPEWDQNISRGSSPIGYEKILKSVGYEDQKIKQLVAERASFANLDKFLGT